MFMAGFETIYKQTVTLFNRIHDDEDEDYFIPTVLKNVHLVIDHSATWNTYGGQQADNVRLHVRYLLSGRNVMIGNKRYVEPKVWRGLPELGDVITFRYGNDNDFDFFIKDEYEPNDSDITTQITIDGEQVTCSSGFIRDAAFERLGFYNHLNRAYDHVFAVTAVSQYNLIPHFEIMAR